jgi:hypothetical protein
MDGIGQRNTPTLQPNTDIAFIGIANIVVQRVVIPAAAGAAACAATNCAKNLLPAIKNSWDQYVEKHDEESDDADSGEKSPPVPDATQGDPTRGPSDIWNKSGGTTAAEKDFNDKTGGSSADKGNGVRVGKDSNGNTVVYRPTSSDGRPTVEIQPAGGGRDRVKVRYDE